MRASALGPRLGALALLLVAVTLACAGRADAGNVTRHVLPNGVTLLVTETPSDLVAATLFLGRATWQETDETAGIGHFVARVMVRGTAKHSARALAEIAETIGGTLDGDADADNVELRGVALARNWPRLLALLAEVTLAPAFPDDEVERERRLILAQIQTREDAPFTLALTELLEDLYPGHPYGRPAAGVRQTVERLSRDALVAHHRQLLRGDRVVVSIAGGVPAARIVKTVEKLFAGIAPGAPASAHPDGGAVPSAHRRVIVRPAYQAQVLVGFRGPAPDDPHYAASKVLSAILGGGLAGRLFTELRDNRGLAYSVGVQQPWRGGAGFIVCRMATAPASAEEAERGVLHEVERVRAEDVTEAELARAKAYLAGALAMDRRTSARQSWYPGFFEAVGAGWDFADRYARALAAVSVRDVRSAAERFLGAPTIVILKPPA